MKTTMIFGILALLVVAGCAQENLSGEAKKTAYTHRYVDYDETDRTIEFEQLSDGSTVSVPFDTNGKGNMVANGLTYAVQVSERGLAPDAPNVFVDVNRNGSFEAKEEFEDDAYFTLAK